MFTIYFLVLSVFGYKNMCCSLLLLFKSFHYKPNPELFRFHEKFSNAFADGTPEFDGNAVRRFGFEIETQFTQSVKANRPT